MKKMMAAVAAIIMMMSLFSGCGGAGDSGTEPGSAGSVLSADQQFSVDSPDSEASGEGEEAVSGMSDEEENISAEPAEGITVRESDYGYSLRYDADRYEYRRVEGYDDYSLKTYEGDKPSVYLCVSAIGAKYFDDVKKSLMTGNVSSVSLGADGLQAEMNSRSDVWDGGEVCGKSYLCRLDDGSGLLIEIQYYTEDGKNPYEADLNEMLDSIRIL